ncbi:MAG: endonuclease, partial [Enterococcus faecalis]|nr:endonuclease [Enterococcus faecalis]
MKIATYNVRVDTEYDQDWQWSFRKEAVCQLINFHDWSLCCIQEVRPNQVRDLKAYTTFTCLSAEREGDGQGEGLAILYNEQKVQTIDTGYFWLSETPQQPS